MRFSIFTIALFANLALIASAFAEEPKAADNGTHAELGSAGRCGGGGGEKRELIQCPEGQHIAAMATRGGAFIDEVSIACRRIPVSGEPGPLGPWVSAGPGGGDRVKRADAKVVLRLRNWESEAEPTSTMWIGPIATRDQVTVGVTNMN